MSSSSDAAIGTTPSVTAPASGSQWRLANIAWVATVLFLTAYGMLTFQAGTKLMPGLNPGDDKTGRIERLMQAADTDPNAIRQSDISETMPEWLRLVSGLSSDEYTYSSDSIAQAEAHYQAMSETKRNALSIHMMLGLVLMATGALQFWPALRRKHRKLHRVTGMTFVAAAFTSMSMSGYHLLTTPIEHIYTEFIFFIGLWFALAWSIISILLAIWALMKKNYALHMGFMASGFAAFLTAPVQRSMWVGLAPFSEGRTFDEMNMAVTSTLFGLCMLAGYALFSINRASSPERKSAPHPQRWKHGPSLIWLAGIASIAATLMFFAVQGGLGNTGFAANLLLPPAIEWHDQIFSGLRPLLFCLAMTVLIASSAQALAAGINRLADMHKTHLAIVGSGVLTAALLISWGVQLGRPGNTVIMGGTFYLYTGTLLLMFVGLFAKRCFLTRDSANRIAEMLWFVFAFALAPAVFYLSMIVVEALSFVPEAYHVTGDGYQLAVAIALTLPPFIGHFAALFSNETKRFAVS